MTIQAALADVMKQCALANIEVIKVTATPTETLFQTFDADKTLFVTGRLLTPIEEFTGEFGLTNLKMLSGLLGFANYQSDSANFKVRTREVDGETVLDQFEFKGSGSRSVFKLMDKRHIPTQASIASIPWDIEIEDIIKAKIDEFQKFAGLYAEVDKHFTLSTLDGNLIATLGSPVGSTHTGSMVLAEEVSGSITGGLSYPVDKFLTLMKIALNAKSSKLMITSKGVLGVEAVTNHGSYNYYLRQSVRG